MEIQLKIGERIILKSDFIKKIAAQDDLTSKTFVISAMTDVAIGLKNLRTGKSYTLRVEDVVNNAEVFEPSKVTTMAGTRPSVPTPKPQEPTPAPSVSVQPVAPTTPVVTPTPVVAPATNPDPSKPDDVFKELYG
jgi:hypothetical protein